MCVRVCGGGGQQTCDACYNHKRQCDGKAPFTKLRYSRFSIIPPAKTSYLKQKQHMLPATRKKEGYLLCCLRVRVGVRKERGVLAVLPRSFCIQLPFFEPSLCWGGAGANRQLVPEQCARVAGCNQRWARRIPSVFRRHHECSFIKQICADTGCQVGLVVREKYKPDPWCHGPPFFPHYKRRRTSAACYAITHNVFA
jgi:hypothetical protein